MTTPQVMMTTPQVMMTTPQVMMTTRFPGLMKMVIAMSGVRLVEPTVMMPIPRSIPRL